VAAIVDETVHMIGCCHMHAPTHENGTKTDIVKKIGMKGKSEIV
jgi:hypothetical protein